MTEHLPSFVADSIVGFKKLVYSRVERSSRDLFTSPLDSQGQVAAVVSKLTKRLQEAGDKTIEPALLGNERRQSLVRQMWSYLSGIFIASCIF